MARLLGGTSTTALPEVALNNTTCNENPDQPAVLQRRFNYFDYLANGQLQGGISIQSFKMLSRTLFPCPIVRDRRPAAGLGQRLPRRPDRPAKLRLAAAAPAELYVGAEVGEGVVEVAGPVSQRLAGTVRIDRNVRPGTTFPLYTLFAVGPVADTQAGETVVKTNKVGGQSISVAMVRPVMNINVKATPASQTPAAATSSATTSTDPSSASTNDTGRVDHGHRPRRPRHRPPRRRLPRRPRRERETRRITPRRSSTRCSSSPSKGSPRRPRPARRARGQPGLPRPAP